nr:MAG TPA: hypothetical protein [Caudoviricetes sp.]DAK77155.1 MAG TPA: hypothetical protein [Caudoviricetes sp.]
MPTNFKTSCKQPAFRGLFFVQTKNKGKPVDSK